MEKQDDRLLFALLAPLDVSLVQPEISSAVKSIRGRGVRRAGRKFLVPLHPLSNIEITKYSITSLDLMAFLKEIIYLQ